MISAYDGWRCLEDRDHNESNELRARYIWGGTYLDELIQEDRDNNADGDFADQGTDYNLYACQDANFNVVALTDTSGNRLERMWYEPYGKQTCHRDSDNHEQAASHFGNPYLFQGQRYDSETGLYYFKNRDYEPRLGCFLQRDIPEERARNMLIGRTPNLYYYGRTNPISLTDYSGWEECLPTQYELIALEEGGWWRFSRATIGKTPVTMGPAVVGEINTLLCIWTRTVMMYWVCPCRPDDEDLVIDSTVEATVAREVDREWARVPEGEKMKAKCMELGAPDNEEGGYVIGRRPVCDEYTPCHLE